MATKGVVHVILLNLKDVPYEEVSTVARRDQGQNRRNLMLDTAGDGLPGMIFHDATKRTIRQAATLRKQFPQIRMYVVGKADAAKRLGRGLVATQFASVLTDADEWPLSGDDVTPLLSDEDEDSSHVTLNVPQTLAPDADDSKTADTKDREGIKKETAVQSKVTLIKDEANAVPVSRVKKEGHQPTTPKRGPIFVDLTMSSDDDEPMSSVKQGKRRARSPDLPNPLIKRTKRQPLIPITPGEVVPLLKNSYTIYGKLPFHISRIKLGRDMTIQSTRTGLAKDIGKHTKPLQICPTSILNSKVMTVVSGTVSLAQDFVMGRCPFYPVLYSLPKNSTVVNLKFEGAELEWVERNKRQLEAAQRDPAKIKRFAEDFSTHFGIQTIHPFHIYCRMTLPPESRGNGIGRSPSKTEKDTLYAAMLTLLDISNGTRTVEGIRADCKESIRDIRFTEWANLLGMHAYDEWNVTLNIKSFSSNISEYVDRLFDADIRNNRNEAALRKSTFQSSVGARFGKRARADRFAGGARTTKGTLAGDADVLDGASRDAPRMQVISKTELLSPGWHLFDLHADPADTSATDTHVRKLPPGFLTKIVKDKPATPCKDSDLARQVLNSSDMVPMDRTMVLRGVNLGEGLPIGNVYMLLQTWKTDAVFLHTHFKGLFVTRLAHRDHDGKTDLSITFATPEHLHIALLTLPRWHHLITLGKMEYVATESTTDFLNPLSALTAVGKHAGAIQVMEIQRAFAHPDAEIMPDSVLPIDVDGTNFTARVTYSQPAAAAKMLGKKIRFDGIGPWPYRAAKLTEPLRPHANPSPIEFCLSCGRLGHVHIACNEAMTSTDGCPTCARTSAKLSHNGSTTCPLRKSFDSNTKKLLEQALAQAQESGIFAPRNNDLLEQLFGKFDLDALVREDQKVGQDEDHFKRINTNLVAPSDN